jgi:uncharacterized protein YebE (UPF0316 family)
MLLESIGAAALIFLLRCTDISIGTVRMIFAVEGRRLLAVVCAFGEATAFIVGAGIVLADLTDPIRIVGFSSGFAAGTALGITATRSINLGMATIRIVSPHGPIGVADALVEAGFMVNVFDGHGSNGPIRLILMNVRKRQVPRVMEIVKPWVEQCMVTVGDDPVAPSLYPGPASLRK